jgi:hypothetical protein
MIVNYIQSVQHWDVFVKGRRPAAPRSARRKPTRLHPQHGYTGNAGVTFWPKMSTNLYTVEHGVFVTPYPITSYVGGL